MEMMDWKCDGEIVSLVPHLKLVGITTYKVG